MAYQFQDFKPKRTFGMELEFICSIRRAKMKAVIETFPGEHAVVEGYGHNINNERWYVKPDASCDSEVASRVLGSLTDTEKTLSDLDLLYEVHKALLHRGARSNASCGGHVHVSVHDFVDARQMDKFLGYWIKFEKFLFDILPHRRKRSCYCNLHSRNHDTSPITPEITRQFQGRDALNQARLDRNKTVEFRLAECSNDPRDSKNWVTFVLYFLDRLFQIPKPENKSWFGFEDGLIALGLYNPGKKISEAYNKAVGIDLNAIMAPADTVYHPRIAEMRSWLLGRAQAFASFSDAREIRQKAREIEGTLCLAPFGIDPVFEPIEA